MTKRPAEDNSPTSRIGRKFEPLASKSLPLLEPLLPVTGSTSARSYVGSSRPSSPRSNGWHQDEDHLLGKEKLPLVNERGDLNIERKGFPKLNLYYQDLFHTLVNLPSWRFAIVLVLTYFLLFVSFAIPYYYEADHSGCIPGVRTFLQAIWFSVQTSMTIGYGGDLTPNPTCVPTNVCIMLQSICSLLVAYSLLGVVYARFSQPTRRAGTIKFSRYMVLHEEDGVPRLAFRVANIRKHQVIEATVRMLVALNNILSHEEESIFRFTSLPVAGGSQIFLGLPCTVAHPVTANSPLHGLSFAMMERCDMEILVLLEGVDASTSAKLQARHSYRPSDIRHNHRFQTMVARAPSGIRSVDFAKFDSVVPVTNAWAPPLLKLRPASYPANLSDAANMHGTFAPPIPQVMKAPAPLPLMGPTDALLTADHYSAAQKHKQRRAAAVSGIKQGLESGHLPPSKSTGNFFSAQDDSGLVFGAGPNATSGVGVSLGLGAGIGLHAHAPVVSSRELEHHHHHKRPIPVSQRGGGGRKHAEEIKRSRRGEESRTGGGGYDSDGASARLLMENSSCVNSFLSTMELDVAHRVTEAEERTKQWRQLVVELAARVQQCPALHAPGADAQLLLDCARDALNRALSYENE
eukprot:jgi/Mesen1/8935/ME000552S08444